MIGHKKNWYFQGWKSRKELSPSGRLHTVWEYSDDLYSFDLSEKGLQWLKISFIAIPALIILVWVLFSLMSSFARDSVLYVGIFWYGSTIPMIYMVMGAVGAFRMKKDMTYRDLYACYRRIKVSSWILPFLFLLSIVGVLVFIICFAENYSLKMESGHILGCLILMLLSLALCIIQGSVRKKIIVSKKNMEEDS
ncbi:MAG: hypothetical protein J5483_01655 [Lachnospiraceae bacterium]|nr:hypothetical protein [Lachnospiraceae bacterium]